jgi:dephospho-CoA kinase
MFESLGGFLVNADGVVAELWKTPEMTAAAVGRWGTVILGEEGHVRHQAVADRIFNDRTEYDWLTGLLYPQVMEEIMKKIKCRIETCEWGVVEIPLFFEAGGAPWVAVTVFVTASKEIRAARCCARGWSEAEMEKRESFFLPSKERMKHSNYVIENNGDLKTLEKTVGEVYAQGIYPKIAQKNAHYPTNAVGGL